MTTPPVEPPDVLGLLVEHAAQGDKVAYCAPHSAAHLDVALELAEDITTDRQIVRAYRANGGSLLDFSGGGVLRFIDTRSDSLHRLRVDVVALDGPAAQDVRLIEAAYLAVVASPVGQVILP